ncbi:MAG: universal stress protein [Chloroflexi bacterium]|nr:universal stress protein [Chloroflexota bacterium]
MSQTEQTTMGAEVRISRILVPTDFSPGAEPALRWAATLRQVFGAELILLHVLNLNMAALAGLPSDFLRVPAAGELLQRIRDESVEEMSRLAAKYPGARTLIREGSPRPVILEVAKEVGADLIVMGTHGWTGLTQLLFGSVAEHVVRHSPVPVLTVRQDEAQ